MNSTGKELSQADRYATSSSWARAHAPRHGSTKVLAADEQDFGQEAYGTRSTASCGTTSPCARATFRASAKSRRVQDYSRTTPVRNAGIETLVKEIRASPLLCALALGTEQDAVLSTPFHDHAS